MNPTGKGGNAAPEGWQDVFLDTLRASANVSEACRNAGIARITAYKWKDSNAAFAEAWILAIEDSRDVVRREILRRGVEGWDEPQFGYTVTKHEDGTVVKGTQVVGYVRKYSDTVLLRLATAHLPEYKEKLHVITEDAMDAAITELEHDLQRRGIDPTGPRHEALASTEAPERAPEDS